MNEFKIDDTFFKDEIDYKDLDESIYTQFAKTMAKNVDIDLAKTPLVDILTGYTRYRILQSKIDKANELLQGILVVRDWEHKGRFRPVKNTTAQDVYKTIVKLNELLETPRRINYEILKEVENVENN